MVHSVTYYNYNYKNGFLSSIVKGRAKYIMMEDIVGIMSYP